MTSKGSKSRIKWEGDSNKEIRAWPADVRQDIGLELHRLDNHEEPLDGRSMGQALPGARELRTQDRDSWYRMLYWPHSGWIYVLHCFKERTNQTSLGDIEVARQRMADIKKRKDKPGKDKPGKELKNA